MRVFKTLLLAGVCGVLPLAAYAQQTPAAPAPVATASTPEIPRAETAPSADTKAVPNGIPAFAKAGATGPVPVAVAEPSVDVKTAGAVLGETPAVDAAKAQATAKQEAKTEEDPLAKFREAFGAAETPAQQGTQTQATDANGAPLPTPGGFQQPVSTTDPLAGYDMSLQLTPEEIASETRRKQKQEAFDQALDGVMPLSTEQIGILKDKFRDTREASETRIGGTPTPKVTVETISLDPGAVPPKLKLSPGHVTSLNMIDITGQPWPVQDVSWGGNFEVLSPGDGGHLIRISPMAATEVGNLSIQLVGLNTPITMQLETDLDDVVYRFDARIPEYGPNSKAPLVDPGITTTAGDKILLRILDAVPPAGTKKFDVSGVDGRTSVFELNDALYIRTPHTLLSPGWSASVSSADGMNVFAIPPTPVVLLSDNGRVVRATIGGSNTLKTANTKIGGE